MFQNKTILTPFKILFGNFSGYTEIINPVRAFQRRFPAERIDRRNSIERKMERKGFI
jgi:hypothetical protein